MIEAPILSAEIPAVSIRCGRVQADQAAALPPVSLGIAAFSIDPAAGGCVHLVDADGQRCGLFVNEQLARQTGRNLSQ